MAQKSRKLEEIISLKGEVAKVVSYADYFARRPLFVSLQIKNEGEEAVKDLILTVENANGMLMPCKKKIAEVPYESTVSVELDNVLSPHYFANIDQVGEEKITVSLRTEKKVITSLEWTVTTMPFEYWQGTNGDLELLASFVRPRLGDCAKLYPEIQSQLKK